MMVNGGLHRLHAYQSRPCRQDPKKYRVLLLGMAWLKDLPDSCQFWHPTAVRRKRYKIIGFHSLDRQTTCSIELQVSEARDVLVSPFSGLEHDLVVRRYLTNVRKWMNPLLWGSSRTDRVLWPWIPNGSLLGKKSALSVMCRLSVCHVWHWLLHISKKINCFFLISS